MLASEHADLAGRLGHSFRDPAWLEMAVTHSSRSNEPGAPESLECNERLELLGDAVVGLVITDQLTSVFPDWSLGRLNRAKAYLVSSQSLHAAAQRLELGRFLQLSSGEDRTGGREKPNLLADAYEAVVAAIFRDAGLEPARAFILRTLWELALREGLETLGEPDAKTALQERLRELRLAPGEYRLVEASGPEHQRTFRVEVVAGGRSLAVAEGPSKKQAELEAARRALAQLPRRED
jgi:ribonuclease-3